MALNLQWEDASDSWFKSYLLNKEYEVFGDCYDDELYKALRGGPDGWQENDPKEYLKYVRGASKDWLHLRLLADFMEVGTVPQRWPDLCPCPSGSYDVESLAERVEERDKRLKRTKVCVLDYHDEEVISKDIDSAETLRETFQGWRVSQDDGVKLRLYVVEDLSRDVIEALGTELDIEADFFRSHIVDYAWYNVRDRWRDAPSLDSVRRSRNWVQLRYVTARHFDDKSQFDEAGRETERFNVFRRLDDDLSNNSVWDKKNAIVGLTRARATFWLKPNHAKDESSIAVLLLDPTVTKGMPLWRGRRNCHPTPTPSAFAGQTFDSVEPKSIFEDFVHWAKLPAVFQHSCGSATSTVHIPMQVLLHLVCSEWRTMLDYIKTRCCQIDLEIMKPNNFATTPDSKFTLEKLHMWRKHIPLYLEMATETSLHIFSFRCRSDTALTLTVDGTDMATGSLFGEEAESRSDADDSSRPRSDPAPALSRLAPSFGDLSPGIVPIQRRPPPGSMASYWRDLITICDALREDQLRIDRLTSVVTAVTSIKDSRRGLKDNRNIGRLTGLATFFIPFSLIAGIFSMQGDLGGLLSSGTLGTFFATSLPLSLVTFLLVWMSLDTDARRKLTNAIWTKWAKSFSGNGDGEETKDGGVIFARSGT